MVDKDKYLQALFFKIHFFQNSFTVVHFLPGSKNLSPRDLRDGKFMSKICGMIDLYMLMSLNYLYKKIRPFIFRSYWGGGRPVILFTRGVGESRFIKVFRWKLYCFLFISYFSTFFVSIISQR